MRCPEGDNSSFYNSSPPVCQPAPGLPARNNLSRRATDHMPSNYAMPLWHTGSVKNFHLPLPDDTYEHLRSAAERAKVPATAIAREAIDFWLRQQLRKERHDAIAAYAAEMAGTSLDLDASLEAAGIDHLMATGREPK